MGQVGTRGNRKPGRRKLRASRKNALADALPDVQPPGTLKDASLPDELPAESDEEDD